MFNSEKYKSNVHRDLFTAEQCRVQKALDIALYTMKAGLDDYHVCFTKTYPLKWKDRVEALIEIVVPENEKASYLHKIEIMKALAQDNYLRKSRELDMRTLSEFGLRRIVE